MSALSTPCQRSTPTSEETVDSSLCPIDGAYKRIIVDFVFSLRRRQGIRVDTDRISTQILGDYGTVLPILKEEMKTVPETTKAAFILKLVSGKRSPENLTEALR